MKRRPFAIRLLAGVCRGSCMLGTGRTVGTVGAALLSALQAGTAAGQGSGSAPVEGSHYIRLSQPVPVSAPPGRLEVLEFFWYGCPHCNAFEASLEPWVRGLPADVAFRRVPVAFRPAYTPHQRIFYALESLGLLETLHRRVFYAIHSERMALEQRDEIAAFATRHGVDAVKFMEAYDSFSVQAKSRQANALAAAYQIDGVPAIGVQGRFYTTGSLAGSNEKSLAVADFLLRRLRAGR